jgi:hypothetical protein
MIAIIEGINDHQPLWQNSGFKRIRRRPLIVILSWFWIVPTFYAMAADDQFTSATRHIYLPELSLLEEIVTATAGIFRDDDEEAHCRVSKKS